MKGALGFYLITHGWNTPCESVVECESFDDSSLLDNLARRPEVQVAKTNVCTVALADHSSPQTSNVCMAALVDCSTP